MGLIQPTHRRALLVIGLALGTSLLLALMSRLGGDPKRSPPAPEPPLLVEVLATPSAARAKAVPLGGRIAEDGRLTVLEAPGSPGKAEPLPPEPRPWGLRPQYAQQVPTAMMGGIRALFRVLPPPPETLNELRVTTLERRVGQGRLLLVNGCFRFGSPAGPLAVFPPGARLALRGGYLMVGPPGLPPELSARVGEEIFWEGGPQPITDPASLRRIARHCGAGQAVLVVPGSATVQQARDDGFAASEWMQTYGGDDWDAALATVRACRERTADSFARQFPGEPRRVMVDNMCARTPPPLITDPARCPAGSSLQAGVCVTPEGYRRPVPD